MNTKSLLSEHGFDGVIARLGVESVTSVLVADEEIGVVKPIIGADGSVAANLIDVALDESSGIIIGRGGQFDGGVVGLFHGQFAVGAAGCQVNGELEGLAVLQRYAVFEFDVATALVDFKPWVVGRQRVIAGSFELCAPSGLAEELKVNSVSGLELTAYGEGHLVGLVGHGSHAEGMVGVGPPALSVAVVGFTEHVATDNPYCSGAVDVELGGRFRLTAEDTESLFVENSLDGIGSGEGFEGESAIGVAGEEVAVVEPIVLRHGFVADKLVAHTFGEGARKDILPLLIAEFQGLDIELFLRSVGEIAAVEGYVHLARGIALEGEEALSVLGDVVVSPAKTVFAIGCLDVTLERSEEHTTELQSRQ